MNILLKNIINQNHPLSTKTLNQFFEVISFEEISKGETFAKKGQRNEKEYIIYDGICRSFVLSPKGEDVSLSFFQDGAISPQITRTQNDISTINLQALTDIKISSFPSSALLELMRTNREMELWANNILQNELLQKVNKELIQASMTAKNRLIKFREKYPLLENTIPHPYIASYLGITNVSLSRLRKEI